MLREPQDSKREFPEFDYSKRQRAFSDFVDGITLTVVGILLVVIFMVSMTNVAFNAEINLKDFGTQVFILYFCTVSVNLLLRSYGRRKGRTTKQWKEAKKKVEENNELILLRGFSGMEFVYCRKWEEEELESVQLRILSRAGIGMEEFRDKYRKYSSKELKKLYPELTKLQVKQICKAMRVKRLKYSEKYLEVAEKRRGARISPSGARTSSEVTFLQTVKLIITSLVTSLFSASLVLEIIAEPTFATVAACLVKIVMLLIFSAYGLVNGYHMTSTREPEEMNIKAFEQKRFILWCEGYKRMEGTGSSEKEPKVVGEIQESQCFGGSISENAASSDES